jgi:hypothetical protein
VILLGATAENRLKHQRNHVIDHKDKNAQVVATHSKGAKFRPVGHAFSAVAEAVVDCSAFGRRLINANITSDAAENSRDMERATVSLDNELEIVPIAGASTLAELLITFRNVVSAGKFTPLQFESHPKSTEKGRVVDSCC